MVRNMDSPSKFLMYLWFLQVMLNAQVGDLSSHTNQYISLHSPKRCLLICKGLGRKDDDNVVDKEVNAAKPIVFNDEEVTMTMAQILIKMKAEKARLLNEQMAKRLHDEEVEQAVAREKQDKDDLEKAKVLQKQYVGKQKNIDWNVVVEQMQEKHLDNIRKYQSLKRKPISIAQARKNKIVYLKNMIGYKMEHFKGMTYDNVRPIFEREYNKVQTLFKPDKDVDEEPTKKRVAKETLLQENFKKLKAVKVSGSNSTPDTRTNDPKEMSEEDVKNMLKIIPVYEFKVEALQVKYPLIDWEIHSEGSRTHWKIIRVGGITQAYQSFEDMLKDFDREDLDVLWRSVKEKFSSAVPTIDKEKALWVELKRLFEPNANDVIRKLQRYMHYPIMWKLHSNCGVHQVSSTTRRHDMYMLTERDYPLSSRVMTLMLNTRLQVEEDSEMARDLVMKIFIKANQPKSRSLDTSSKLVVVNGLDGTGADIKDGISLSKLLLTPKSIPPPMTYPLPALTQPSKLSSPLAINIDPIKLLFFTPPTSPQALFDTLEDLLPTTTNPPPTRPSFDSIERLSNEPPPLLAMEPPLPPLPPQLPTIP
nr:hypothetical protein [Tanacetum cinerariifolium]